MAQRWLEVRVLSPGPVGEELTIGWSQLSTYFAVNASNGQVVFARQVHDPLVGKLNRSATTCRLSANETTCNVEATKGTPHLWDPSAAPRNPLIRLRPQFLHAALHVKIHQLA
jgi:hypothetical protein